MSSYAVSIVKQFAGQDNIITCPRVFIKMTGDHMAALVLSQLLYWWQKSDRKEFYKSDAELGYELEMTPYQLKRARKILEKFGLKSQRKGIPARMFYDFDEKVLNDQLVNFFETEKLNSQLLSDSTASCEETSQLVLVQTSQLIQKTTQKTTQKTKKRNVLEYSVNDVSPPALSLTDSEKLFQNIHPWACVKCLEELQKRNITPDWAVNYWGVDSLKKLLAKATKVANNARTGLIWADFIAGTRDAGDVTPIASEAFDLSTEAERINPKSLYYVPVSEDPEVIKTYQMIEEALRSSDETDDEYSFN